LPSARSPIVLLRLAGIALLALLLAVATARAQERDIRVGAFVTSVSGIDLSDGSFAITLYAWFIDPAGQFDPERDMYVLARTVSFSEVESGPAAEGGTYTTARIEAVVNQEYSLLDFPFDEQRLSLRLEAAETTDVFSFVPDTEPPQIDDYVSLVDWTIEAVSLEQTDHAYSVRYGLGGDGDQEFSQIAVHVDVKRARSPILIDDFLGFIFAFLVTSLTFLVPCTELGLRIGMTTGSLFAAVVNLNRLIDAGGYKSEFGLVERIGFLIFGAILISLLISISTKHLTNRLGVERANRLDTILGATNMSIFLGLILWILLPAID
jgi:hypothetical protein